MLPQEQPERGRRALAMVAQIDREGFGGCTFRGESHEACPKVISIDCIVRMNGDDRGALWASRREGSEPGSAVKT